MEIQLQSATTLFSIFRLIPNLEITIQKNSPNLYKSNSVDRKNSLKRTTAHTVPRGGNGRGATEELRWSDGSRSLVRPCADNVCV